MTYKKFAEKYLLRFNKGDDLFTELNRFANATSVQSGNFEGIGSFDKCELGYYTIQKKDYHKQSIEEIHEVVSLLGNLSQLKDKPFFHIHVTISNQEFQAKGGHLFSATVGATLEIVFEEISSEIKREFNDEIGLNLLDL